MSSPIITNKTISNEEREKHDSKNDQTLADCCSMKSSSSSFFKVANPSNYSKVPSSNAKAVATARTARKVLRRVDRQQQRRAVKLRHHPNGWVAPLPNPSVADYKTEDALRSALISDKQALDQLLHSTQEGTSFALAGTDAFESSQEDKLQKQQQQQCYGNSNDEDDPVVEWTLKVVDPENTIPQTMEEEVQRLQVLHSYLVLDSMAESEFDRITQLASQVFQVKTCLISLVDLGRQWFLSCVGLDDKATETPRKHSFCAHVVLSKQNMVIVPDATKDVRFRDNPSVADPNSIQVRFYAGAALISPEGYKLGTLCCVDYEPRPDGLSVAQQEMLHSMASMVVHVMVARRDRLLREAYQTRLHQLAQQTLNETHLHLQQVQQKLRTLVLQDGKEDQINLELIEKNRFHHDSDLGADGSKAAASSADLMRQVLDTLEVQSTILSAARRNILQETPVWEPAISTTTAMSFSTDVELSNDRFAGFEEGTPPDTMSPTLLEAAIEQNNSPSAIGEPTKKCNPCTPTTDMIQLFDSVNEIVAKYPLSDTVTIELGNGTPQCIVAENLLLFRSTLNLILHCMEACNPLPSKCGLRIKSVDEYGQGPELLVEAFHGPVLKMDKKNVNAGRPTTGDTRDRCSFPHTAAAASKTTTSSTRMVTADEARKLFLEDDPMNHAESMLRPVAVMVRSMGGRFGMFTGRWMHSMNQEGAEEAKTIYWFRIPYEKVVSHKEYNKTGEQVGQDASNLTTPSSSGTPVLRRSLIQTHRTCQAKKYGFVGSSRSSHLDNNNKEQDLLLDPLHMLAALDEQLKHDPALAALMEEGCGSRPFQLKAV